MVAATAAVVIASCGGDGVRSGAERSPSPATDAPATTEPDEPVSTSTTEAEPEAVGDFSQATLTLDDLPPGWSLAPEAPEGVEGGGTNFCNAEEDPLDLEAGSARTAEAEFQGSDTGPFVTHVIAELPEAAAAVETLHTFRDMAEGCPEWHEPVHNGPRITWRVAPLPFPEVGDESVAFRMTTTGDFAVTLDLVMWRDGGRLGLLGMTDLEGTDVELLERLVTTAADRL